MRRMNAVTTSVTLWLAILVIGPAAIDVRPAFAEPAIRSQPTPRDRRIAKVVAAMLKKYHLSQQTLDDELSGRALELFLS